MGAVELKDMMVHVERIVRPVRAQPRRKLAMRRELLGHLQAALEEERAGGLEEGAAWEAAKKRLGEPAELTRELQKSVGWLRTRMWGPVRGLAWIPERPGGSLNLGVIAMKPWQAMLFMVVAQGFIYGGIAAFAMAHEKELLQGMAEHTRPVQLAVALWVVLIGPIMWFGLTITEAAAQRQVRRVIRLGLCGTAAIVAWQAAAFMLLGLSGSLWLNVAGGVVAGVVMTAGLAWLGRFLRPGIRDFGEWMTLEIGQ
jgi:hypothetical protein